MSCGADLRESDDERSDDSSTGDRQRAQGDTLDDLPVMTAGEASGDETEAVPTLDRPADPPDELATCPACGAPNSPNRYLCGRCGAELATGESTEQVGVVPNPAVGARSRDLSTTDDLGDRTSDRRWRIAASIVIVGVALGAALGALVAFELGPFASASGTDDDGPVFDRAAYPDEPQTLAVASVAATSGRPDATERSDPSRLVDGDPATAWNGLGEINPDGIGEVIELELAEASWISQILFANGDQQDSGDFAANARVKRTQVTLDGRSVFIVNLLDERGQQAVRLPVPRLTTSIRFEVLEVYPGDTYDDLGLSEIAFRGHVANAEDAQRVTSRS